MMRVLIALTALACSLIPLTAASADTQPTQGFASTGRNDAGFGGGPHCHVNAIASSHNPGVDFIEVFPSHTGHLHSGLADGVFQADPNCDGAPGN